ncbi:uncharacterized protein LOC110687652 [Chenopodium quinoa]|uniref:6,7-dimethyl-8-ribityllumazine synthase n=1 Tax=Chenopodium quinoa TaxID=63459 RepID=A0A803KS58_CHEQI|nr:uncharacterized protein LOC110687652 [Chenopodium quinoa]
MGNSLRCCLACVLPCGALDLIRIVHLNGYVEEITRAGVTAGEFLQEYPNHVLSKPCSQGNMVRKIMILSSDSELKRGSIYFLLPDSSLPSKNPNSSKKNKNKSQKSSLVISHDQNLQDQELSKSKNIDNDNDNKVLSIDLSKLEGGHENISNEVVCETNLKIKSKSGKHQRRRSSRGKSGIWQPHLEIITEDL